MVSPSQPPQPVTGPVVEAAWVERAKLPVMDHAPLRLEADVPVVGLRVPVPDGRGLPRCDLYLEATTIDDGDYWVARDIRRIVVAGQRCRAMVIYDHHLPDLVPPLAGGRMAKPGGPALPEGEDPFIERVDVDFDGEPELRIRDADWWGDGAYFKATPAGDGLVHLRELDRKGAVVADPEHRVLKTWRKRSLTDWDIGWHSWERGALRTRQVARLMGAWNRDTMVPDAAAPHRLDIIVPTHRAYEMAFAGVTRATRPEEVHLLARTDEPVPATTSIPSGLRVPMPEALGISACDFYFEADEARDEERWSVQGIRRISMAGDGCDTRVIFASAWFEDDAPLAGGVVAKPGGAPLGEGEVPLLELVDVTFDGVPEVRIHAGSGRQERAAFFRVHPDGRSLVHLAAMFSLPNPRPDPASHTIETSSAPTMAQHDTSAYAWRAGRLEKVRHRYTLHEHRPDGGAAPRDHAWKTEVVLRAGRYEVVSDGLVPVRADPH